MANFLSAPFLFLAHVSIWIVSMITGTRYQLLEGMAIYVNDDGEITLIYEGEDETNDE